VVVDLAMIIINLEAKEVLVVAVQVVNHKTVEEHLVLQILVVVAVVQLVIIQDIMEEQAVLELLSFVTPILKQ